MPAAVATTATDVYERGMRAIATDEATVPVETHAAKATLAIASDDGAARSFGIGSVDIGFAKGEIDRAPNVSRSGPIRKFATLN